MCQRLARFYNGSTVRDETNVSKLMEITLKNKCTTCHCFSPIV